MDDPAQLDLDSSMDSASPAAQPKQAAKRARTYDAPSSPPLAAATPPADDASAWPPRSPSAKLAVMAPMVRVGTLPFRRVALRYGADAVFSEELIDHKVLRCVRSVDERRGTVDFRDAGGSLVFSTTPGESVVLQLGTSDAARALRAATVVAADVRGIDINMGCPLKFSVAGGMGSALLRKPELVKDIVSTLRRNLSVPVSCKIRLLESEADSVQLAKVIEAVGACALSVHARYVPDKSHLQVARWAGIRPIVDALSIPVLANGDVMAAGDFERIREATGCAGVMVARGAMWNPSIFRCKHGAGAQPLPVWDAARAYLDEASNERFEHRFPNTKYCMGEMLKNQSGVGKTAAWQQKFTRGKSWQSLSEGLDELGESVPHLRGAYKPPARGLATGRGA